MVFKNAYGISYVAELSKTYKMQTYLCSYMEKEDKTAALPCMY